MTFQKCTQKATVCGDMDLRHAFERHPRECGDPSSGCKHEKLSDMDSRFRGNDVLNGQ